MELTNFRVAGVDFKDPRAPQTSSRHIVAEIVVLDRTKEIAGPARLYRVNHAIALSMIEKEWQDNASLSLDEDSFELLGEVVNVDKGRKIIFLSNDNTVSYSYLIVVTGRREPLLPGEQLELQSALGALLEAIKVQQKGLPLPAAQIHASKAETGKILTAVRGSRSSQEVEKLVQSSLTTSECERSKADTIPLPPRDGLLFELCV